MCASAVQLCASETLAAFCESVFFRSCCAVLPTGRVSWRHCPSFMLLRSKCVRRLYAFAYKSPFPRLSLSFRSCALLCLLRRESDMDLFECVFCCSVIQAVGGLDLGEVAAGVCACHVIGYLACFCPSVFRVNGCIAGQRLHRRLCDPTFPCRAGSPCPFLTCLACRTIYCGAFFS